VSCLRIRWSDKEYGSVVIHLTDPKDAQALLQAGIMDIGGQMAYVKRRSLARRYFKCQQYGHKEARCKTTRSQHRDIMEADNIPCESISFFILESFLEPNHLPLEPVHSVPRLRRL